LGLCGRTRLRISSLLLVIFVRHDPSSSSSRNSRRMNVFRYDTRKGTDFDTLHPRMLQHFLNRHTVLWFGFQHPSQHGPASTRGQVLDGGRVCGGLFALVFLVTLRAGLKRQAGGGGKAGRCDKCRRAAEGRMGRCLADSSWCDRCHTQACHSGRGTRGILAIGRAWYGSARGARVGFEEGNVGYAESR